jgi:hypothetical protein
MLIKLIVNVTTIPSIISRALIPEQKFKKGGLADLPAKLYSAYLIFLDLLEYKSKASDHCHILASDKMFLEFCALSCSKRVFNTILKDYPNLQGSVLRLKKTEYNKNKGLVPFSKTNLMIGPLLNFIYIISSES